MNETRIDVAASGYPGAPKGYPGWMRAVRVGLTLVALPTILVALFASVPFFWGLLETVWALLGARRGPGWGIALALATVFAWCLLYFAQDALAMWGNRGARERLRVRAAHALGRSVTDEAHFVEWRVVGQPSRGIRPDIGWLVIEDDGLSLVGDRQRVWVPRPLLTRELVRLSDGAGLLPAHLDLPLVGGARLRLLARGDATRLSATRAATRALEHDLRPWLGRSLTSPAQQG